MNIQIIERWRYTSHIDLKKVKFFIHGRDTMIIKQGIGVSSLYNSESSIHVSICLGRDGMVLRTKRRRR